MMFSELPMLIWTSDNSSEKYQRSLSSQPIFEPKVRLEAEWGTSEERTCCSQGLKMSKVTNGYLSMQKIHRHTTQWGLVWTDVDENIWRTKMHGHEFPERRSCLRRGAEGGSGRWETIWGSETLLRKDQLGHQDILLQIYLNDTNTNFALIFAKILLLRLAIFYQLFCLRMTPRNNRGGANNRWHDLLSDF